MNHNQDLGDFLAHDVYPALFARLDAAFPEFGFKRRGKAWVASNDDTTKQLCSAGADRVYCYENRPHCLVVQGGDAVRFLDLVSDGTRPVGQDFVDAVRTLADKASVSFPERELSPEAARAQAIKNARQSALETVGAICAKNLFSDAGREAREYLKSRGLSEDQARDLGLGLYPPKAQMEAALRKAGHHDEALHAPMVGYVVFPWADATGQPLTLTSRWPAAEIPDDKPKMMNLPGEGTKASPLYFDRARGQKDVTIVEGLFDAAGPQAHGLSNVVATGGGQLTEAQAQTLARYGVKYATIFADADDAGHRGTLATIRKLEAESIASFVVRALPHGQDPDDFFREYGPDGWKDRIERAEHGFSYEAQMLVANHLQGNEWTDRSKSTCLDAAIAFDHAVTNPARLTDLAEYFWPVIKRETGCDMDAVQARLDDAREKAAREREHKAHLKLATDYKSKLDAGDLDAAKKLLHDESSKLRTNERRGPADPIQSVADELDGFLRHIASMRGREFIGLPQRSLKDLDEKTLGLRGLMLLAAAPNVGKTTLGVQLGIDVVTNNEDAAFLFVSLEMARRDMLGRLLCNLASIDYKTLIRGSNYTLGDGHDADAYFTTKENQAIASATDTLRDLGTRIRIIDDRNMPEPSLDRIIAEVADLKATTGASRVFVLIDYLQVWPVSVEASKGIKTDNDADKWRIGQMKELRDAISGDPIMVISEARKPSDKGPWANDLADVMGSARGTYTPDMVLFLNPVQDETIGAWEGATGENAKEKGAERRERDARNGIAHQRLVISKIRDGGERGSIGVTHHFRQSRYSEWGGDQPQTHGPFSRQSQANLTPSA